MKNHEMVYLKAKLERSYPRVDSHYFPIGMYKPDSAAKEIESNLGHWRTPVENIVEIEIKDFRSNLSAKRSMPDDYILTVETLANEIKDMRLEIFEELNGDIEL